MHRTRSGERKSGMQSTPPATKQKANSSPGALLVLATVAAVALSFLPGQYSAIVLYPIRLFVTLIHESGHAMAAVITGGQVSYLQIMPNGEGVTWARTSDLTAWVYISGGYLGAAAFGATLLAALKKAGWKSTLRLIGAYVLAVTLLWAHNPADNLFTLLVGLGLSGILFACSRYLNAEWAGFAVAFLAVQCCLNALTDLRILLYLTTATDRDNDAVFMAQRYPLPPVVWACIWMLMAAGIMVPALRYYLAPAGSRSNRPASR
jgi:Peptidase M50B-like